MEANGNNMSLMEKEIKSFKVDLIRKRKDIGALIPLLQSAQDSYGYIPKKVIYYISELAGIPAAEIYGVITFYSQFRLKPLGKYVVKICEGTACHVNGGKDIVKTLQNEVGVPVGETTEDGLFTLQSVACIGCCSLAPVIMINEDTHGNLTPKKTKQIIRGIRKKAG